MVSAERASDGRSAPRTHLWLRGLLAGPLALLTACLLMAGAALWLPPGPAQINNLVLPIVLFPLLWATLFLYACLERRLGRAYAVIGALAAVNGIVLMV